MNTAPPLALDEFLRLMPKAELHCHLFGTIRPATMLALAEKAGARRRRFAASPTRARARVVHASAPGTPRPLRRHSVFSGRGGARWRRTFRRSIGIGNTIVVVFSLAMFCSVPR